MVKYYIEVYGEQSDHVINCVKGAYSEPHVEHLVFENMLKEAGVHFLANFIKFGWNNQLQLRMELDKS